MTRNGLDETVALALRKGRAKSSLTHSHAINKRQHIYCKKLELGQLQTDKGSNIYVDLNLGVTIERHAWAWNGIMYRVVFWKECQETIMMNNQSRMADPALGSLCTVLCN